MCVQPPCECNHTLSTAHKCLTKDEARRVARSIVGCRGAKCDLNLDLDPLSHADTPVGVLRGLMLLPRSRRRTPGVEFLGQHRAAKLLTSVSQKTEFQATP